MPVCCCFGRGVQVKGQDLELEGRQPKQQLKMVEIAAPAPPAPPPEESTEPQLNPAHDIAPLCKGGVSGSVTVSAADCWDKPWRGFGTSLAWFANWVGRVPPTEGLDEVLDLLFDPEKGMGLNVVRFNIGGGCNTELSPGYKDVATNRHKYLPGYKPGQDKPHDWAADAFQRNLLLGARKRGADVFNAISYSPPWWMTVSGDVAGGEVKHVCNLKPEHFTDFADYLTEVVKHYREVHHIPFESLEPLNEPADGVWTKGGRQEGCSFPPPDQEKVLPLVHKALADKCPGVVMSANDSWVLNVVRDFAKFKPETLGLVSQIHAHGYITQSGANQHYTVANQYKQLRDLSHRLGGKEVWQTEWCPILHSARHDIDLALVMARYIVQAVNFMDVVVWCYWQAVEQTPRFSCLTIKWHPKTSHPHTRLKKFWAMKQLVKHIPPGSFRVIPTSPSESEHCVTAFYDPAKHQLAVFVVNQEGKEHELSVFLKGFSAGPASKLEMYRTSLTEDFERLEVDTPFAADIKMRFVARSLTSLVFTDVQK